ncbi:DUF3307 domain-containing protein [Mesonia aestuariivivens]|uniref:DUF3307 domain-containing protein n=1 Tax=Mesonia aestuariivivens TaxID=2796128 RepID=A0ABS6VYD9_9FLAO|nr:DUF3307 domain-containing protein [Mesonia aestuariivivens]MBW2960591.1 DUF3307 domain-containing protein [Mesonia aestuariivivens]
MMLLLQLILAHLLGDFLFQPYAWVKEKEHKKLTSNKLYLHVGIHLLLTFLLIWNLSLWYIPLIIAVTHLGIDAWKLNFQNEKNRRLLFFLDQLFHFIVIFGLYFLTQRETIHFNTSSEFLCYATGAFFLTTPVSIMIKTLIAVYRPNTEIEKNDSLENAGKYIGILERLLVFVFIASQHWEGVGFLIAAKSIFRFSDLTESKDRKLTEYILIGTLLSFGISIVIALLCNYATNLL